MVGAGTLLKTQALAGGIDFAQGGSNRFAILGRDQGISRSDHTGEPRLDLRQQSKRGFATAGPHPAYTCAIKNKDLLNTRQRDRQKSTMPPEAEAHHIDGP